MFHDSGLTTQPPVWTLLERLPLDRSHWSCPRVLVRWVTVPTAGKSAELRRKSSRRNAGSQAGALSAQLAMERRTAGYRLDTARAFTVSVMHCHDTVMTQTVMTLS